MEITPFWHANLISYSRLLSPLPKIALKQLHKFSQTRKNLTSPLVCATILGRADIARIILLSSGKLVNSRSCGNTCIFIAAQYGHVEVAKTLLDFNAAVDFCPTRPVSPLHNAALMGDSAMVELLLSYDACVEGSLRAQDTPLHAATAARYSKFGSDAYVEVARLLMMAGAEVDQQATFKITPLSRATKQKHYSMMALLLDWGACPKLAMHALNRPDISFLQRFVAKRERRSCKLDFKELVEAQVQHVVVDDYDDFCISCIDRPREMLFLPCGHLIMCKECLDEMFSFKLNLDREVCCPFCSEVIQSSVQVCDNV